MDKNRELFAAVDLGSNSFRLLLAEIHNNKIHPVIKSLETVRLAEKMRPANIIHAQPFNRGIEALKKFAEIISEHKLTKIRVCGTAALRQAKNSADFVWQAKDILNSDIEIISGEQEADLSLKGILSAMPIKQNPPAMIVDVGGGSSEIIFPEDKYTDKETNNRRPVHHSVSLSVGAVSMTERFFPNGNCTAEALQDLDNYLVNLFTKAEKIARQSLLAKQFGGDKDNCYIIGSGGTATSLAALDLNLSVYVEEKVQNHQISFEALKSLLQKLATMSASDRNKLPPLKHGRADIITAGAAIFKNLMELTASKSLMISDAGLLEGILISCKDN